MLNHSEENYLKAIWSSLTSVIPSRVTQASLARQHGQSGPAAHKIVHKLISLGLIEALPDATLALTTLGRKEGALLVRKHRLWEVFLVEKLGYDWGEVHEIAENLEHIGDAELINRLEAFLNSPRYDPHGDPIPDRAGMIEQATYYALADWALNKPCKVLGVREQCKSFLDWMQATGLVLGTEIVIRQKLSFDGSLVVEAIIKGTDQHARLTLSAFAADHIIVGE